MKPLKQHLKEKIAIEYEEYSRFAKKVMDNHIGKIQEAVVCWLKDHKADIGNKIYDHRVVAETIFDELVGELEG